MVKENFLQGIPYAGKQNWRSLYLSKKSQSNKDSSWIIDNKLEITPQEIDEFIEKGKVNKIWNKNEL